MYGEKLYFIRATIAAGHENELLPVGRQLFVPLSNHVRPSHPVFATLLAEATKQNARGTTFTVQGWRIRHELDEEGGFFTVGAAPGWKPAA